jgi:hypothetical protein
MEGAKEGELTIVAYITLLDHQASPFIPIEIGSRCARR